MFRLIGFLFKTACFAYVVLILGNWVQWEGRSVSDQVRIHMRQVETSDAFHSLRRWALQLTHDARKGYQKKIQTPAREDFSASERQKLKELIHELNRSYDKESTRTTLLSR